MTEAEFTCEMCGGTFPKGRSDADAEAEALAVWGIAGASSRSDMAIICDDCWHIIGPPVDD